MFFTRLITFMARSVLIMMPPILPGAFIGAEYPSDWEGSFGGNTARLDFTRTLYLNLGLQYEF